MRCQLSVKEAPQFSRLDSLEEVRGAKAQGANKLRSDQIGSIVIFDCIFPSEVFFFLYFLSFYFFSFTLF